MDVVAFARESLAFVPDPDQIRALDPAIRRGLLNCCRQWGKSTTAIERVERADMNPAFLAAAPTTDTLYRFAAEGL